MTQPPTGPWGPPPQQPGGWPGQPPQGQWGPGQWPPPVPPKRGGALKWVIGGVALLAVIATTAVVAVSCDRHGGTNNAGGGSTATSGATSDIASANDKGPVGIITEDPSCAPWGPIISTVAGIENNGWTQRDPSIPASSWTPEIRAQFEAVGKAMRNEADQTVQLAKMTPHRVMRELYGQITAYARAYADSIPTYTPVNDYLAQTSTTAGSVISYICDAISSGSAAARASLAPPITPPTHISSVGNLANPSRIFNSPDTVCSELSSTLDKLLLDPTFKAWLNTDPKIPGSNWSADQRSLNDAVAPLMSTTADNLEKLVTQSDNPLVQDFILLGVQYRRTYIQALPTYQPNDDDIYSAGQYAPGVVSNACKAVAD